MKMIVIETAFHPETPREYNGEHIYKIVGTKGPEQGYKQQSWNLDNGAWVTETAPGKLTTNWTTAERWGRVVEVETDENGDVISRTELGMMILRVDRSKGLL